MIDKERYAYYLDWMKKQEKECGGDVEQIHRSADFILKEFLLECGYDELVKAFEDLPKWYA